jgi:hypothetical protein
MFVRYSAPFWAIALLCLLASCGGYYPGFEGPLGIDKSTVNITPGDVTTKVQCELSAFMSNPDNAWLLKPDANATLQLKLETDHSGKVTWLGIDLSKLGPFPQLGNIIAASNKVPSLQASGQVKSTITSQLEFNMSQSPSIASQRDCDRVEASIQKLYLKQWLEDFAKALKARPQNDSRELCLTKVTLNTGFTIVVDVNGGFTPLAPSTLLLPISGTNFDYSPTFIHNLNIVLTLDHNPSVAKLNICKPTDTIVRKPLPS